MVNNLLSESRDARLSEALEAYAKARPLIDEMYATCCGRMTEEERWDVLNFQLRMAEAADVARDDMAPIYEISGEANGE